VNELLPRLQAVTAEDVRRVARKYLVKTNRSVLLVQPAPAPTALGSPGVSKP
jgi:predicted Zn-dependent peptidase